MAERNESTLAGGTSRFQYTAGVAALLEATIYASAIVYFLIILEYASVTGAAEMVELFVANETSIYVMNLLTYVVFGVLLVVLVLALHQRLQSRSPALVQSATIFGLIWAGLVTASGMVANIATATVVDLYGTDPSQAATVWMTVNPVIEGLGGGNEIVGGLWTLLVSVAALRAGMLHRILNYLGLVVGRVGILSAIPRLGEVGGGCLRDNTTRVVRCAGHPPFAQQPNRIGEVIQYPMVSSTTDRIGTRSSRIPGSRRR
jgi:hypothetical protein